MMYGVDPEIANSWDGLGRCPVTPNLTEWLAKVGYYHKPYLGKVNFWTRPGGVEQEKRRMLKEWRAYKRKKAKEAKRAQVANAVKSEERSVSSEESAVNREQRET